jgi:hypothetical protein
MLEDGGRTKFSSCVSADLIYLSCSIKGSSILVSMVFLVHIVPITEDCKSTTGRINKIVPRFI